MSIQNQTDKELADAGRMLVEQLNPLVRELTRRGYEVQLQGYHQPKNAGIRYEVEVERVTKHRI